MLIRSSHIERDFHIFIFIYIFTIIGYMTNSQLTIYPCGLIAQWIEHYTGIARSWVRVLFKPEIFFRLLFQLVQLKAHCEDHNFTHVYPQFTYMIFIYSYLFRKTAAFLWHIKTHDKCFLRMHIIYIFHNLVLLVF